MTIDDEDQTEDDELLLTDEVEEDGEGAQDEAPSEEAADEEIHLVIEGEDDGNEGELVRRLRDQIRTAHTELAAVRKAAQPKPIDVGVKPTLEGCEWDPDRFEGELDAWKERKRQAETQERDSRSRDEERQREFERRKARHMARAAVLKIPDFEARERAVIEALGPEMAGAALVIADDSAKLVGALGANPAALAKIQDEPDPLLKLKLLIKMEANIKTKKPPAPEAGTIQRGSAPAQAVSADKRMEQLEREAERTGNRAKIIAYKASLRAA